MLLPWADYSTLALPDIQRRMSVERIGHSRKEKIVLIIEAGEYALSTRKLVLETAGLNVISAVTAEQAYRLLNRCKIDVALLDTDISDEPLADIARRLTQEGGLDVFALTAREWEPDELRGLVRGIFQKMNDPQIMVNGVLEYLGEA